jgi:hypothetical protein
LIGLLTREEHDDIILWDQMPGKPGLRTQIMESRGLHSQAVRLHLATLPAESLVAVVDDRLTPITSDWPWEALGLFERYPDTVIVGGRIFDDSGGIVSAGEVFGLDGLIGCPERRWHDGHPGYYGMFICQRTVDAVSGSFFVSKAGFLHHALATIPNTANPTVLGAWLGAMARRQGKRVIYSPHIASQGAMAVSPPKAEEIAAFTQAHGPLLREAKTYSRFLSRESASGYSVAASA